MMYPKKQVILSSPLFSLPTNWCTVITETANKAPKPVIYPTPAFVPTTQNALSPELQVTTTTSTVYTFNLTKNDQVAFTISNPEIWSGLEDDLLPDRKVRGARLSLLRKIDFLNRIYLHVIKPAAALLPLRSAGGGNHVCLVTPAWTLRH
jgi:hypothetical protein